MKSSLLTLVLISLSYSSVVFGQTQNLQDVVYLKNGSVIHGTIIEEVPNKSIKIETSDGNIFFYQMDEIEKLTKEPSRIPISENGTPSGGGYAGNFEIGINQILSTFSGTTLLAVHLVNGFAIGRSTIGLGLGIETADGGTVIPIWIDSHSYFTDGDVKPGIYGHLGYALGSGGGSIEAEGFSVGAGLSVKFQTSPGFGILLDVGYRNQTLLYENYGAIQAMIGIAY
jgi:hypothetical protein